MKTVLILGGVAIAAVLVLQATQRPTPRPTLTEQSSTALAGGIVALGSKLWDRLFSSSSSSTSSGSSGVTYRPISSGETVYV